MFTDGLHKALCRGQAHETLCDANGLETILSEQTGCIDTYTILIHFFRETRGERTRHSEGVLGILLIRSHDCHRIGGEGYWVNVSMGEGYWVNVSMGEGYRIRFLSMRRGDGGVGFAEGDSVPPLGESNTDGKDHKTGCSRGCHSDGNRTVRGGRVGSCRGQCRCIDLLCLWRGGGSRSESENSGGANHGS